MVEKYEANLEDAIRYRFRVCYMVCVCLCVCLCVCERERAKTTQTNLYAYLKTPISCSQILVSLAINTMNKQCPLVEKMNSN